MKHILPEDIERTSMSIIAQELREKGIVLPEESASPRRGGGHYKPRH